MKKVVVLVSGGIDSSTVLALVKEQNFEIHALSFNYMQRHNIELAKIREFIKKYDVAQHKVINIDLKSFGGSALTDTSLDVPKYNHAKGLNDEIPVTYVPARNTIFLSYALGFAEVLSCHDIFIGVHASDYSNYPDCRPEFIKTFEEMANHATKIGAMGERITIHAPLMNMTKSEIIKKGLSYGVDYSQTISCYDPSPRGESCGRCHSCLIRLEAFAKNCIVDPISYVRQY